MSTSAAVAAIGGATYLSLGVGLLRGILYTRVLTPTSLGIVRLVFLFTRYLSHPSQGILHGLTKRVPLLLGQGDEAEAERMERSGITAVFALAMAAAAFLWAYAAFAHSLGMTTRWALAVGGFYLVFMQLSSVFRIVLRSRQYFRIMARSTIFEALLLLLFVVVGSWLLDAPGTMLGWALGLGIVCLYVLSFRVLPGTPRVDLAGTVKLTKVGLPLLGVGFAETFLRTADQIVIAKLLGLHWLGYYGVAWQLSSYLYNVPGALGDVVIPKILKAYGEGGGDAMRRSVLTMTRGIGILMPVLAGVAAILGPILVRIVLDRYIPAIPPLEILLMATVFLAIPTALKPTLIARNREIEMIVWNVLGGLIGGGLVAWQITRDASLAHLAAAAGVGWVIGSAALAWRGLRLLDVPTAEAAKFMLDVSWPFVYGVVALWGLKAATRAVFGSASLLVCDLVAFPAFILVTLPLVWYAERATGIPTRMIRRD